jgi:uncharacterized protein (DUF427 family)
MTLTIGTGPFGDQGDKTFNFEVRAPRDHVLFFEDSPRRVRVMFGGEIVADSRRIKLIHEQGHLPVYYFPRSDVRMDLLEATDLTTHCPFKGEASYWPVRVSDRVAENAVWVYPEPIDSAPPLADYLAFYWNKMETMVPPCSAQTHSARVQLGNYGASFESVVARALNLSCLATLPGSRCGTRRSGRRPLRGVACGGEWWS